MLNQQNTRELIRARNVEPWISALNHWMPQYSISSPIQVAAFMAQCAHESALFTATEENLNYSESALRSVFGRYFRDRDPAAYARRPEAIANVVYANRMGNGNTRSGDGWRFRGRGIIQLTGRDNYTAFAAHINEPLDRIYEKIAQPDLAVRSACWFWSSNNLNNLAEDIVATTRRINGGTNGLDHRKQLFDTACAAFGVKAVKSSTATSTAIESGAAAPTVDQIKAVQTALGLVADGKVGPKTRAAVRAYQKEHGLKVDGIIGVQTIESILK